MQAEQVEVDEAVGIELEGESARMAALADVVRVSVNVASFRGRPWQLL